MRMTTRGTETAAGLRDFLRDYYGKVLQQTGDLQKKACCADDTLRRYGEIVRLIPAEVKERNFGCGCTIPADELAGLTVLDLGSGAGLDAFLISRLVGEGGRVVGVDMTDEQLAIARRNAAAVAKAFGYSRSNVQFLKGYIETLDEIPDGSIDLVVSDCVINLSPRKDQVFRSVHRVLREGGEFYVSDIVADRRVPEAIEKDPELVAECLGGALYEFDLHDTLFEAGFLDVRTVSRTLVERDVNGAPIRFFSATLRGFRFEVPLDRRCEDYGQVAWYRGNCPQQPATFVLDRHHAFEAGKPVPVCRNTARMLSETRLAKYFEVSEPRQHLGLFDCGGTEQRTESPGGRCC